MEFDPSKKPEERRRSPNASGRERLPPEEGGTGAGMPAFLREQSPRIEGPVVPALKRIGPTLQRSPMDGESAASVPAAAPVSTASEAAVSTTLGLIVEDSVATLAPGQMTRSQFLSQLRASVCATAEEALKGTIWSVAGCPWVDHWFGYYSGRSGAQIERAISRYAPEASGVNAAADLIPIICGRVRSAIASWTATGEVTGVPEEAAGAQPEPGVGGGNSPAAGVSFKRDGSVRATGEPRATRRQLGAGHGLDGSVRTRMESAFGQNFSGVRVHTDEAAGNLSQRFGARAFTISDHIAFGRGEYQPGSLVGDALLAHELAHVVQQGGASLSSASLALSETDFSAEEEADRSAVQAVLALWGGAGQALSIIAKNGMPRLRSGLRLQRCKSERQKEIERLGALQFGFLEEKRKKEEERQKKEADEAAKKAGLPHPTVTPKVEMSEVVTEDIKKHASSTNPTTAWTTLSAADQANWKTRAAAAWASLVTSVKGTELEKNTVGATYNFDPETALKNGWYAWQNNKTLSFGMSWVKMAELDPKNVQENLAHELGGHLEYGTTYGSEIMSAAIDLMPAADRDKWRKDSQKFFEAYEYPETEIYSAIRQLRYTDPLTGPKPSSGGIDPYANVPKRLNGMKDVLQPDVAKAVLIELKRRIDASPEILQRDKDYYVAQVKAIFGYSL